MVVKKAKISYDEMEDVLYVNFSSSPQKAEYGKKFSDFIIRFKKRRIVGVTILNASVHLKELAIRARGKKQ